MRTLLDLFCGRGGWTKAAAARGWKCVGYDIEDHGYPGELIKARCPVPLEELRRHNPSAIIASPPCEEYARRHLPWINKIGPIDETLLRWSVSLIDQFECPVIVECNRFAGWHVPGGRYWAPYTFWGHVPALMPLARHVKDKVRGSSRTPRAERIARAAEIPESLAGWIMDSLPT